MTPPAIAPDVVAFLQDEIESLEEVELMALLAEPSAVRWTAADLTRKLGASASGVPEALDRLRARKLVETRPDGTLALSGRALRAGVGERLARAFVEQRNEIMTIMTAHALDRVRGLAWRAFSDAFVIGRGKKDKPDG